MAKVEHVVVDSGAFIKNAPLWQIGENIVTIRDVVAEIRDKATRQRLQVLPYELQFREPSTECLRIVTEFSKKTGDYRNLSAVDIRLLALTYQLEKEHCGTEHIKTLPDSNITWQTSRRLDNPTEIAGFYLQTGKGTSLSNSRVSDSNNDEQDLNKDEKDLNNDEKDSNKAEKDSNKDERDSNIDQRVADNLSKDLSVTESSCSQSLDHKPAVDHLNSSFAKLDSGCTESQTGTNVDKSTLAVNIKDEEVTCDTISSTALDDVEDTHVVIEGRMLDGDVIPDSCLAEESGDESTESDDDDDDEGWITPSNIRQMKARMGDKSTDEAHVKVGCLTTDFAMQNVLIQMGLNVISVDGMLIKRAKSYVQRCYGCFKISTDLTRQFCKHCGNATLHRVSMTVREDGSISYFLSTRKVLSTRGKKFALPMPKGGKYSDNPILTEDQREAQHRGSKSSRVRYDVMDPDYVTHPSPFAPNDTQSRAAQLGWGQRTRRGATQNRSGRRH